jgi:hypothetical protein
MRKLITRALSIFLFTIVLSGAGISQTAAQTNTVNQYAAKFVCGKGDGALAALGQYFTIINVHNPSPNADINFRKKFALGDSDERVGRKTRFWPESLHADEVMGIDCPNIYKHTEFAEGTFIEGYVVIESRRELDVISVYTAGGDHVEAFHTERVPFRKVPFVAETCPDLNLNISTGVAAWRITSDPISSTSEPRSAPTANIASPFWNDMNGSQWIGALPTAGLKAVSRGRYVYELSFCLCAGFSNAKLNLRGLADDSATVFLNNTALTPALAGVTTADIKVISATGGPPFIVGTNVLRVVVNNRIASLSGLNINGSITATAGACHEAN